MKKCCLCPGKVPNDGPDFCDECLDEFDRLTAEKEQPREFRKGIVDLEEDQLPF